MTRIVTLAGFLDPKNGQIRDRKTLAKLDTDSAQSTKSPADSISSNERNLPNALGLVRSRTYEQISTATNSTHSALDDLKAAKKHNKKEADTLKKLQAAIESGDDSAVQKHKVEFEELQNERKELAGSIAANNSTRGSQTIRVGNRELLSVTTDKIEFSEQLPEIDLTDEKQVKKLRQKVLKEERQELNATQSDLKTDLQDLKTVTKAVNEGLDQLLANDTSAKNKFYRDFESAQESATATSQALVKVGGQAVLYNSLSLNSLALLE